MKDEAKTVESVMKEGMRRLLIRDGKRGRKNEEAMEGRRDMEKTCPLQRKHFDQTFLKSLMRGANPQGGDGGTNPLRYEVRKRMEISGKEIRVSGFDSAEIGRYTNKKLGGEKEKK